MIKLKGINLCSTTIGQMLVELMVSPPTEKECSPRMMSRYDEEIAESKHRFYKRSRLLEKFTS